MQRVRKRLTRKEVKQDEFLIWTLKIWAYAKQEYTKILAIAAAAVVVILIAALYQRRSQTRAEAVIDAFGEVRISLYQGKTGEAILQAERIVDDYEGNPEARHATVFLGNLYFELGRHPEAQAAYQSYLDNYGDGGALGYAAASGVAACLEEQNDYSGAIVAYTRYAETHPSSPYAPFALTHAARCSGLTGDTERQVDILRKIVESYSNSSPGRTARTEIEMLVLNREHVLE